MYSFYVNKRKETNKTATSSEIVARNSECNDELFGEKKELKENGKQNVVIFLTFARNSCKQNLFQRITKSEDNTRTGKKEMIY